MGHTVVSPGDFRYATPAFLPAVIPSSHRMTGRNPGQPGRRPGPAPGAAVAQGDTAGASSPVPAAGQRQGCGRPGGRCRGRRGIMDAMTDSGTPPAGRPRGGLFAALFDRGAVPTGDGAWLQAMLDAEAALARALEAAALAPAGAGAAVTQAARADRFDAAAIGAQAALTGNPVPALVRALTAQVPEFARPAVHL